MEVEKQTINIKYFYIAIAGIFMLIICHSWLSDGMFMDGTIYAVLSRNMANCTGTFWQPHFSDTFFPLFVEHPPLAFGIEGVLYRLLMEIIPAIGLILFSSFTEDLTNNRSAISGKAFYFQ